MTPEEKAIADLDANPRAARAMATLVRIDTIDPEIEAKIMSADDPWTALLDFLEMHGELE